MLFVGDGPDGNLLKSKIEDENLKEKITMLGKITDKKRIAGLFAGADMFLFPSLYDVSSIVQIESASRYTPVAFAENSVTSCTVEDGVDGYVFPLDESEFASGVLSAVKDKRKLKKVGEGAYKNLYKTWDEIVEKVEKIYDKYLA